MSVTKAEIKRIFNAADVKQYGSKQLFLVDGNKLVSYRTIVAILIRTDERLVWIVTDEKFSVTTTRHINHWLWQVRMIPYVYGSLEGLEPFSA